MKFGWEITIIALLASMGVFIVMALGLVLAITKLRLPGINQIDFERRKRIIEAYARSLIWCVLGAAIFGVLLVVVLTNGINWGRCCLW